MKSVELSVDEHVPRPVLGHLPLECCGQVRAHHLVRQRQRGFLSTREVASPDTRVGIGLFGMKERAALTDGVFELRSTPGRGTQITVRIPTKQLEATHEPHPDPAG